jgi:hypothetical protein
MSTRKVARSAIDGRFVSRRAAHRWPQNTVVETIEYPSSRQVRRRRAARHLTEENQNRHGFKAGKDIRSAKGKNTGSNFKAGRDL